MVVYIMNLYVTERFGKAFQVHTIGMYDKKIKKGE